ncbi:MAG: HEPN domain-containing protein [Muribaculaceae bacterium]|nr:HEPN domain-containing protein [Muribaculaceae bacterium]
MKEKLDSTSLEEFIYYRVKRSEETLAEADCLANSGHFSGAINRLYYACYYIVTALLIANDISASTHNGVRAMFALKFIKSGKMDISHGKFFNEIFEIRHSNDYDDFVFCDLETFNNFRPRTEFLINAIKTQLNF